MSEKIMDLLHGNFRAVLEARMSRSRTLHVDLEGHSMVYRAVEAAEAGEAPRVTPKVLRESSAFRRIMTFGHVLMRVLTETLQSEDVLDWGQATLPFHTVSAYRIAGRLMEQLGHMDRGMIDRPPGLGSLRDACVRDWARFRELRKTAHDRIVRTLTQKVAGCKDFQGRETKMLCFRSRASEILVDWLTEEGGMIRSESLGSF